MSSTALNQQEFISRVLSSFDRYKKEGKAIKKQIQAGNKDIIDLVVSTAESVLQEVSPTPTVLLNSIRSVKDAMDSRHPLVVSRVFDGCLLDKMIEIALFRVNDSNEDRGFQYFKQFEEDPDTQVVGNSLLRIVLECFMFWPIMFEEEIELSLVFEQLSEQQVTFPKDINYFKAFYKTLQENPQQQEASRDFHKDHQHHHAATTSDSLLQKCVLENSVQMNELLEDLSKLLLVPTLKDLDAPALKGVMASLERTSKACNDIEGDVHKKQASLDADSIVAFCELAEVCRLAVIDYQLFTNGAMSFDDFSTHYGIVPASSNEIKLRYSQVVADRLVASRHQQQQIGSSKVQQKLPPPTGGESTTPLKESVIIISPEIELQSEQTSLQRQPNAQRIEEFLDAQLDVEQYTNAHQPKQQSIPASHQLKEQSQSSSPETQQGVSLLPKRDGRQSGNDSRHNDSSLAAAASGGNSSRQSRHADSVDANRRTRDASSFKQLFEDPLHISIMRNGSASRRQVNTSSFSSNTNRTSVNKLEEGGGGGGDGTLSTSAEAVIMRQVAMLSMRDAQIDNLDLRIATLERSLQESAAENEKLQQTQQHIQETNARELDQAVQLKVDTIQHLLAKNQQLQDDLDTLSSSTREVQDIKRQLLEEIAVRIALEEKVRILEAAAVKSAHRGKGTSRRFEIGINSESRSRTVDENEEMMKFYTRSVEIKPTVEEKVITTIIDFSACESVRRGKVNEVQITNNIARRLEVSSTAEKRKDKKSHRAKRREEEEEEGSDDHRAALHSNASRRSHTEDRLPSSRQQLSTKIEDLGVVTVEMAKTTLTNERQQHLQSQQYFSGETYKLAGKRGEDIQSLLLKETEDLSQPSSSLQESLFLPRREATEKKQLRTRRLEGGVGTGAGIIKSSLEGSLPMKGEGEDMPTLSDYLKTRTSAGKRLLLSSSNDSFTNNKVRQTDKHHPHLPSIQEHLPQQMLLPPSSRLQSISSREREESSSHEEFHPQQANVQFTEREEEEEDCSKFNSFEVVLDHDDDGGTSNSHRRKYEGNFSQQNNDSLLSTEFIQASQLHLASGEIPYSSELFRSAASPQQQLSNENQIRLRKACLSEKSLLFEKDDIKVGVTTSCHVFDAKQYLKIQLFLFNRNPVAQIPQISLNYLANNAVSVWTKPEKLKGSIDVAKHLKQDIIVDIQKTPYQLLVVHVLMNHILDSQQQSPSSEAFFQLPTSLNRFMEFRQTNSLAIKAKWQTSSHRSLYSGLFEFDTRILRSSLKLAQYFPHCIELSPHHRDKHLAGLADYKLAGVFAFSHIPHLHELMIKLTVKPMNRMQVAIAPGDAKALSPTIINTAIHLIQTLTYIFRFHDNTAATLS